MRILSLLLAAGALFYRGTAPAQVSVDVPPEDPAYDLLQRTTARGWTGKRDIHAIRPLTIEQLDRLRKLAAETGGERALRSPDLKQLHDYLERHAPNTGLDVYSGIWGTNSRAAAVPEVDAFVNPPLEQTGGRWREGGAAAFLEPRFWAHWGGWGAFELRPRFHLGWALGGADGTGGVDLYGGSLKLGHGGFEVQLGRFPVRWGHGFAGSLVLGGSQTPLDGMQIRNALPVELPWILRHLGPVQFSAIVARLDGGQLFPHPYLVAQRLGLRPSEWIELGFAQVAILGGEGSPEMSVGEGFLEVLGYRQGDIDRRNLSNRNFTFDFRLVVPPLRRASVYSELYLEDCCAGPWRRDISNLAGVTLPNLGPAGRLTLGAEWVRTTYITYRNSTYRSGFESRGHLLGHPIGPDAMGFYLLADYRLRDRFWIRSLDAFERRGRSGLSQGGGSLGSLLPEYEKPEDRIRLTVWPTWLPPDGKRLPWLRAGVGYEHVRNFAFDSGRSRNLFLASLETGMTF